MPPKKGSGGKKDEERDFDLENIVLMQQFRALQHDILREKERIQISTLRIERYRKRTAELSKEIDEERGNTISAHKDMTRQTNHMREINEKQIKDSDMALVDTEKKIDEKRKEIDSTRLQKDLVIDEHEEEIRHLQGQSEAMFMEMSDLLKEQIERLCQRVDVTHSAWDSENSATSLASRLIEFSLINKDATAIIEPRDLH